MSQKCIFITTSFEGFHQYKNAPAEVAFLREIHRHIFHVRVQIEVFHNDRDIEFILFKRFVDSIINQFDCNNLNSCESISDEIYKKIITTYPGRSITIIVSEDNENGCICKY